MKSTGVGKMRENLEEGAVAATLLLLAVIPALFAWGIGSEYFVHIVEITIIWAMLATSLNLLVGYTGPESFAHGALFGIGGFSAAILAIDFGLPISLGILLGGLATAVAALFIALPSLRLKGIYFAILTIAFQVIYSDSLLILDSYTGGLNGLSGIPTLGRGSGMVLYIDYYVVLVVCTVSIFIMYRVIHSGLGDTFRMIKQDEEFAEHLGYNTTQYKILSFVISAFFAGVAGGLFAQHNSFMGPTLSNIFISFQVFVFVIVGGAGYFWGPIIATAFLTAMQEVFSLSAVYAQLLTALLLLIIIITVPDGLASVNYSRLLRRLTRRDTGTPEETDA